MSLLMRPGPTLLLASLIAWFVAKYIDALPLIGGMLQVMLNFFAVFALVGGIWLLINSWRSNNS